MSECKACPLALAAVASLSAYVTELERVLLNSRQSLAAQGGRVKRARANADEALKAMLPPSPAKTRENSHDKS